MFSWVIAFLVIALIAAVFGVTDKFIFIVALILAIVRFIAGRRPAV
jgi:uncharacterized membrane protein YtjA (UPF0391 family)